MKKAEFKQLAAIAAMQGLLAGYVCGNVPDNVVTERAVRIADSLALEAGS